MIKICITICFAFCLEVLAMGYSTADHVEDSRLFSCVKKSALVSLQEQCKNAGILVSSYKIASDTSLMDSLVDIYAKASFLEAVVRKHKLEDTRGEDITERAYMLIGRYIIAHNKQFPSDLLSVDMLLNQAKLVTREYLSAFFCFDDK